MEGARIRQWKREGTGVGPSTALLEARKAALREPQGSPDTAAEAGTGLNPLKRFRHEFEQRAAAKRPIEELMGKVTQVEVKVEEVYMRTSATADGQNTNEGKPAEEEPAEKQPAEEQSAEEKPAEKGPREENPT